MQPVSLFDLAAQQARWLSVRQSAVAGNVANVNTPGFQAVDVMPFEQILDGKSVTLAATQPGHIKTSASSTEFTVKETTDSDTLLPSGNSVKLEDELLKAGEVRRAFELNTAITKAFHRMILTSSRAGG